MKISFKFSIDISKSKSKDDDVTIDLVGTHKDIPVATYDNGFLPNEDKRRK